jgi:hypothetical protein
MNKKTILIKSIVFLLVCLVGLSVSASAQRRKTPARKTTPKATTTTVSNTTTATNALEIRSGADKVSTQLVNVTRFIYLLGGIARTIEDIDKEVRTGGGTSRSGGTRVAQNETNKRKVIDSIRNLRAGLAALEVEFRTKPALRNYLVNIQGITDLSGNAEDQALGGQFTESGRTFLQVIEKLSNTLAALP